MSDFAQEPKAPTGKQQSATRVNQLSSGVGSNADAGRIEIEGLEGYGCCRVTGEMSFQQAIEVTTQAIARARKEGIKRLLVDSTKLTGFPAPTTFQRYEIAERWAQAGGGIRVALVARPEMIDPKRFGVTVARNRGLMADVFSSEEEAIRWLLDVDDNHASEDK